MWKLLPLRKLCGNISKKFGKIAEIVFCGDVAALEDRWLRPRGLSEMELSLIGDLRPDESPALPVTSYDAAFRTQDAVCLSVCVCVLFWCHKSVLFLFVMPESVEKPYCSSSIFFHPRSNILLARKTRRLSKHNERHILESEIRAVTLKSVPVGRDCDLTLFQLCW